MMPDYSALPHSEACERNKDFILKVLSKHLQRAERVLEVGSGTGQHAVYFSAGLPEIIWQTADQVEYLLSLEKRIALASHNNLLAPFELDVNADNWLVPGMAETVFYDAVFTANTFHIMDEIAVENFFKGLPRHTCRLSKLIVYGPFKYQGTFTSDSNRLFDESLRSRGVGSAIRDIDWIQQLALNVGFQLLEDISMPANNQCLIFDRGTY